MLAFIYCRSCDWSQDDFWCFWRTGIKPYRHWGYNPIRTLLESIRENLIPRRIVHDEFCRRDYGWRRVDPCSWWLIWWHLKRTVRVLRKQHWWTWRAWTKAIERNDGRWPPCPRCGKNELRMD